MSSIDDEWEIVNVSQKTGQKVTGSLTSWQTQDGTNIAEHVAMTCYRIL
jgi:hypothetical protein